MSAHWYKSSYSTATGENCVECRTEADQIAVRDSQHPERGHLSFPAREWRALVMEIDKL